MSHASLAARYRPQTFAEVTGQETVKAILSRAAAEDKVAPAYLLSGTRGVGKTTIARIFAKALNCVHAPTGEPCNQCEQCRRITMGNHVDVVEIDGASNRGIDDARRLREAIAYAPMEGRYKVFIIDEAHMLTRESFNALLKTLEEPPPRATFILATTEARKFPITIVSRCQHFIFKAIPEAELVAHLTRVLNKEGIRSGSMPSASAACRRACAATCPYRQTRWPWQRPLTEPHPQRARQRGQGSVNAFSSTQGSGLPRRCRAVRTAALLAWISVFSSAN